MLKNTRRPVTYGKATRRYLLSETQEDPQQRRLWSEPSPDDQEGSASSPHAAVRQQPEAQSYDFDVPSSDSDSTARPLGRPLKKRKLTPPVQRPAVVKDRDVVVVSENYIAQQSNSHASVPSVSQLRDDFEVPSSEDEAPRAKTLSKSTLPKKQPTITSIPETAAGYRPHNRLAPSVLLFSPSKPGHPTHQHESQMRGSTQHAAKTVKRPRVIAKAEETGISKRVSQENRLLKDRQKGPKARPAKTVGVSEVCSQNQSVAACHGEGETHSPVSVGRPMTPSDHEDSDSDDVSDSGPYQQAGIPSLTPGALRMTDLTMNDGLACERTSPPHNPVPKHSRSQANTPRAKLKDRLVKHTQIGQPQLSTNGSPDESPDVAAPFHSSSDIHRQDSAADIGLQPSPQSTNVGVLGEGRRKVTYGRQRSHLSEMQEDEAATWAVPLVDVDSTSSSRRLQLKPLEENPTSQESTQVDLEDEDVSPEKPLRSVHELRAAGGARRTGILLESIFDDIQAANTTGSARGAVFRLAEKLLEPGFPVDFVRHGSLGKLFNLRCSKTDLFIDSVHGIALLQVLLVAPVADLSGQNHMATLLTQFSSLTREEDALLRIANMKRSNMSRAQRADLIAICRLVTKQAEWNETRVEDITPRLIGLRGLDICSRRLRQAGYMGQLVGTNTFESISELLLRSNEDSARPQDSLETRLATSVLESLSIGDFLNANQEEDASVTSAVGNIVDSLLGSLHNPQAVQDSQTSLILRLCLNISTKASSKCSMFARSDSISAVVRMIVHGFEHIERHQDDGHADLLIDNLVLGFGLLTNVIEELPECRENFLRTLPSGGSCLTLLLAIFQAKHETAAKAVTEAESKANVAFGYLSVLLCSLCLKDNIRALVASELKDKSLLKLREAMAQFVIFHQTLDMDSDSAQPGISDSRAIYVERLQQVLSALNTVCLG